MWSTANIILDVNFCKHVNFAVCFSVNFAYEPVYDGEIPVKEGDVIGIVDANVGDDRMLTVSWFLALICMHATTVAIIDSNDH